MNLEAIKAHKIKPIEHAYTTKDSILYALGLGYGGQPADANELQFVYEKGLKAVPSISVVLAHPGFWVSDPALGIDWIKILHGEQSFEIFQPLPASGAVRGSYEVIAVEDRGPEKGAIMHVTKRLHDVASDALVATVTSVYMLRGDGGQGGFGNPPPAPEPIEDTVPSRVVEVATLPQAALIYRLSGDLNPIHADPAAAAKAGFPRTILHGLCSMGLATRALISSVAENDPARLRAVSVRFSKPVFPGETLRVEIFGTGPSYRFRAIATERNIVVLDRGTAMVNAA
jgi:acyl dehydratase